MSCLVLGTGMYNNESELVQRVYSSKVANEVRRTER